MTDLSELWRRIEGWAEALGFQQIAVTDADLSAYSDDYLGWLAAEFHGSMRYMARNRNKRLDPALLQPGTIRMLSARMDYLPEADSSTLADRRQGYISRYALGRDYHKVLRRRLAKLASQIQQEVGGEYRALVDSAPVLEKPVAEKAGLGWIGKHTLLLNREAGSYFFLGEIYTNIPLPVTAQPVVDSCGSCKACMTVCPTQAIVGPRRLDARKCISYLTIENKDAIPVEYRKAIGNRIYGCDDCQIFCPWNRYAVPTKETDFAIRHGLDHPSLIDLLKWDERTFDARTRGMAIRRINYIQWVRNIAVAAGNSTPSKELRRMLLVKMNEMEARKAPMVVEHLQWALSSLEESS